MVDEIKVIFFSFSNGKKTFQFGGNAEKLPTLQGKEWKVGAGAGGTVLLSSGELQPFACERRTSCSFIELS